MGTRKGDGAITFTDMSADELLNTRRDLTEEQIQREREAAVRVVERAAENHEITEEEKCKILEVLGLG